MEKKLSIKELKKLRNEWLKQVKEEQEAFNKYINYMYDGIIMQKPTFIKFYEEHKKEWEPELTYDPWENQK